jgi:hypothetical protein
MGHHIRWTRGVEQFWPMSDSTCLWHIALTMLFVFAALAAVGLLLNPRGANPLRDDYDQERWR